MEIRRLKHLVALADTRNFGRAARQCHLSQPAFNRSIQAAEEELGLQLFDRGTIEVRCTDAGAFVVERARKLIFESRCLERDVSLYRERLIGDIALGVGPYPAATMATLLLTEMRKRFPGVNIRVEVNNSVYLAEHLRAEELDFYVADLRNIPPTSDFDIERIGQLSAGFYVRADHPLLEQATVQGIDFLPFGVASVQIPQMLLELLPKLLRLPEGVRLPIVVECDDLHILKAVAMSTDTIVACADAGVIRELEEKRLVPLRVEGVPVMFSDMGVVSLKGRSHSPVAQYAISYLGSIARQHMEP
jgi:DNA-binding transcriptional LysR family regulator